MAARTSVLVLGHSFVRRAFDYMQTKDLRNLNLPSEHFIVTFSGRGGASLDVMSALYTDCGFTPDLVILDIGTNDLASVTCTRQATNIASRAFDFALHLIAQGVKHVVILEVLPRMGGHYWTPAFAPHAKAYNRHILALVYHHKDPTPISFWFHAGLASNPDYFAADGVHLSDSGTSKYIKSLKRAILKFRAAPRH